MIHADAVSLVELELSRLGCMTARHFVGTIRTEGGGVRRIGVSGHADLSGVTATGRAIAVEVKVGRDSARANQRAWAAAWSGRGGLYGVVRPDADPNWREGLAAIVAQ